MIATVGAISEPNGVSREFVERYSCFHWWQPIPETSHESCSLCLATCKRDSRGRIVDYSTTTSRLIESEQRERRARELAKYGHEHRGDHCSICAESCPAQ